MGTCAVTASAADGDKYTIGICQLVQHEALDAATQGFKDEVTKELGEDAVTFDEQNAQGDSNTCSTIVTAFVSDNVDLILANATPALQAAAAGIQNSLTFNVFITNNPMDFAVPELITILIPKRLAKISVVRRPSIKLKITPHIQPNDNPLKNMANIL